MQSVREVTRLRRVTQQQIADALGVTQSSIRDKFIGRSHWRAFELATVADLCAVDINVFLGPADIQIDIRPSANLHSDIPGYPELRLLPAVTAPKRAA